MRMTCLRQRYRSVLCLVLVIIIIQNMLLLLVTEKEQYFHQLPMDSVRITRNASSTVQRNISSVVQLNVSRDVHSSQGNTSDLLDRRKGMRKILPSSQERLEGVIRRRTNESRTTSKHHKTDKPHISESEYYQRKPTKVNTFRTKFLIVNEKICSSDTEIVIIVHSLHQYQDRRNAIRETWGSSARTSYNHNGGKNTSLAFSFGVHKEHKWNQILKNESYTYGDIIQGDFLEAYNNMTYKSLMEIKWVLEYCKTAKYLLKSDDDMFLNLPHLSNVLKSHDMRRGIMGPYNLGSRVYRRGKWAIAQNVYPFETWPEYESGSAYIISADLLQDLFETSEYIPPIHIDDVYITGILAKVIGVNHVRVDGFAFWNSRRPTACDIIVNRVVTGTKMTSQILLSLWKEIKNKTRSSCEPAKPAPIRAPSGM